MYWRLHLVHWIMKKTLEVSQVICDFTQKSSCYKSWCCLIEPQKDVSVTFVLQSSGLIFCIILFHVFHHLVSLALKSPIWGLSNIFILFDRVVACVAGGISHASAFVLVAKPWTRVAKPWEGWWRVKFRRASPGREYGGSAARPLTNPASYAG